MGYELYNALGDKIVQSDLQDKMAWCSKGEDLEFAFIKQYGTELELIINPKKNADPTVADFIHIGTNRPADLKTQNTPFFTSKRYGVEPQNAITFNKIDLDRYRELYPNILIYYSVEWIATKIMFDSNRTISVNPMAGVWRISLKNLIPLCSEKNLHEYIQRKNDVKGNAKSSYVVDLTSNGFKRLYYD